MTTERKAVLTERQRAVYLFIVERVQTVGWPPTVREIGERFNLASTGSVRTHLHALARKGYIGRQPGISRGIMLLRMPAGGLSQIREAAEPSARSQAVRSAKAPAETRKVPVVGRVAAGPPILAVEDIQEILELDERLAPSRGELFALRVRGDSMINAGIHDGDYVFVRPQREAQKGDIIAAIVDGEATIKTYVQEGACVKLLPANDNLQPTLIDPAKSEFQIVGKVTGMMRRF